MDLCNQQTAGCNKTGGNTFSKTLYVDSKDRTNLGDKSNNFKVELSQQLINIKSVRLAMVNIPQTAYNVNNSRNKLRITSKSNPDIPFNVTLRPGNYGPGGNPTCIHNKGGLIAPDAVDDDFYMQSWCGTGLAKEFEDSASYAIYTKLLSSEQSTPNRVIKIFRGATDIDDAWTNLTETPETIESAITTHSYSRIPWHGNGTFKTDVDYFKNGDYPSLLSCRYTNQYPTLNCKKLLTTGAPPYTALNKPIVPEHTNSNSCNFNRMQMGNMLIFKITSLYADYYGESFEQALVTAGYTPTEISNGPIFYDNTGGHGYQIMAYIENLTSPGVQLTDNVIVFCRLCLPATANGNALASNHHQLFPWPGLNNSPTQYNETIGFYSNMYKTADPSYSGTGPLGAPGDGLIGHGLSSFIVSHEVLDIDFGVENSMASILGFEPVKYTTSHHTADQFLYSKSPTTTGAVYKVGYSAAHSVRSVYDYCLTNQQDQVVLDVTYNYDKQMNNNIVTAGLSTLNQKFALIVLAGGSMALKELSSGNHIGEWWGAKDNLNKMTTYGKSDDKFSPMLTGPVGKNNSDYVSTGGSSYPVRTTNLSTIDFSDITSGPISSMNVRVLYNSNSSSEQLYDMNGQDVLFVLDIVSHD